MLESRVLRVVGVISRVLNQFRASAVNTTQHRPVTTALEYTGAEEQSVSISQLNMSDQ